MNVYNEESRRLLATAITNMDTSMARTLILDNNVRPIALGLANKKMINFIRNVALLHDNPLLEALLKHNRELGGKVLWTVLNNIQVAKTLIIAGASLNVRQEDTQEGFVKQDWVSNILVMRRNLRQNNARMDFSRQNWDQDIPPKGFGSNQSTLLHVLVRSNDPVNLELADFMIRHGADVNAVDENGNSILKCAIEAGVSNDFIEKLLHNNIHYHGRNVVTIADCDRTADLMPLIITSGTTDENVRRDQACQAFFYLVNSQPAKLDAMIAVLELDVPIDVLDYKGDTALHNAVMRADPNLVEFLLKRNADPNIKTSRGLHPLWIASTLTEAVISSLLIKHGGDIDGTNENGQRPIHGACKGGSINNIFLLIRLGADINVIDTKGQTPFSMLLERLSYIHAGKCVEDAFFIRQFALAAFRGVELDDSYMRIIEKSPRLHALYVMSFNELQQMQRIEAEDDIPYYTFLTGNFERISRFTRRKDFARVFEDLTMLKILFPCYFYDLQNTYIFARERENQIYSYERLLDETITDIHEISMPYLAIHKIIDYLDVK